MTPSDEATARLFELLLKVKLRQSFAQGEVSECVEELSKLIVERVVERLDEIANEVIGRQQ
jgi:hypothetical protein